MEEMKEFLTQMFEVISEDKKNKTSDIVLKFIQNINDSKINYKNPEDYNLYINYKIYSILEIINNELFPNINTKDENSRNKLNFIFLNYVFIENNIEKLIQLKEGNCCCMDKTRTIINLYLKSCLSNDDIPDLIPSKKDYYIPKFGTSIQWIEFCNSLIQLYYGNNKKYIVNYKKLLESEVKKFEYILHNWYIKFKDGTEILFKKTYDENIINPLKDIPSYEDYYILNKNLLKDKNYPLYEEQDEFSKTFSLLFNTRVKVPKEDVKEIYKISEKIFI